MVQNDGGLRLSIGQGHAVYELTDVTVEFDGPDELVLLTGELTTRFLPYGRESEGPVVRCYRDAGLVITHLREVAEQTWRTSGTRVEDPT